MWICTNKGFISVVADPNNPGMLKVRARNRDHLTALFPAEAVIETTNTDYRFRAIVPRDVVSRRIAELIDKTAYGNFKDSVKDPMLKSLYGHFWDLHWDYQEKLYWKQDVVAKAAPKR